MDNLIFGEGFFFVANYIFLVLSTTSYFYSCGLSTATIEYSCPSVCVCVCVWVCVCVCVCVCVHDNSKNNGSIHLKLDLTNC